MLPMPRERMFYGYDDDLAPEQLTSLLNEGRLWLALHLYDEDQGDEALSELRDLPQAIASYTAAQVYWEPDLHFNGVLVCVRDTHPI